MQVPSGQSIIIGGLMFNSRSSSNAGLPWLRRIPFLNLFTASRQRTQVDKEVLIVVTPHLYTPGLRTPLPFLKVFQKPVDQNLLRATPTESGDNAQY
jgi:pilus assembly protein CpaC